MKTYNAESTIQPKLLDRESSKYYTYIRNNIQETQHTDEQGNVTTFYTYEETKYTKEEYDTLVLEQTRADVDYLSIMTGVELDV